MNQVDNICTDYNTEMQQILMSFTNVVPCVIDTVCGSLVPAWLFYVYFLLFTIQLSTIKIGNRFSSDDVGGGESGFIFSKCGYHVEGHITEVWLSCRGFPTLSSDRNQDASQQ